MKDNKFKYYWQYLLYTTIATLWIALIAILPDFLDNPISGIHGVITIAAYVAAVSVISFLLLYLVSLHRLLATIFIPIYGVIGAAVSYYRVMYHVTITPLMIDCILHTNLEESMGVISWSMIVWVGLNLIIAIAFLYWRWHMATPQRAWLHACVILILFSGYYFGHDRLHQSINQRYPMHIVESLRQHIHLQRQRQTPHEIPPYQVLQPTNSMDIIVVIGESVRADHLSLNGYTRSTTPMLEQRSNVVSLPHIHTDYTHTLASVPVLLTRADSLHEEYQFTETSFATILKQEGYHTAWISNQDLGESFAVFPSECDTTIWANAGKSVFVFSGWYDQELLPEMDKQLELGHARNLLILHTIGSHWYYNNHVPEQYQVYQPVTNNRVVTNNDSIQVINSYDNSIVYTDWVLEEMILRLEDRCAVLIYLSDHGESLGENGQWLHAAGAEETKNPACVVWYSDSFEQRYPDKIQALRLNSQKRYRTDFLFHSVLDIANIQVNDLSTAQGNIIFQN